MELFDVEDIALPIIGSTGYYEIDDQQPELSLTLVDLNLKDRVYLLTLGKDIELATISGKGSRWFVDWKDGRNEERVFKKKKTAVLNTVEIYLNEQKY